MLKLMPICLQATSESTVLHCFTVVHSPSAQNISTACTDGSVRLVNGDIAQEGTLEICADGVWGTICKTEWSTVDSRNVACKQMGYDFGHACM